MEKTKAERRITSIEEWENYMEGEANHTDKIAILDLPKKQQIVIKEIRFFKIELVGETMAVIDTTDPAQIILKDKAAAIVLRGSVLAKGESQAYLFRRSSGEVTNRATAYAFDNSVVMLQQSSAGWLYGEADGDLQGNAMGYVGEYASATKEGNGQVFDLGTTGAITIISENKEAPRSAGVFLKNKYKKIRRKAKKMMEWAAIRQKR